MRRRDKSIKDLVDQHNRILKTIMSNPNTSNNEKNARIDRMNAIGSAMERNIRRSPAGKEYLANVDKGYAKIDELATRRNRSKTQKENSQREMYEEISKNNQRHKDFENKKFSYSTRAGING